MKQQPTIRQKKKQDFARYGVDVNRRRGKRGKTTRRKKKKARGSPLKKKQREAREENGKKKNKARLFWVGRLLFFFSPLPFLSEFTLP